jgi:tryptophan halogenase
LLELLPAGNDFCLDAKEFNRLVKNEYEKIRDFIILHYHINQRPEAFWRYCANMPLPESLQQKLEIFKQGAQVVEYETGLFMSPSWLAVYLGQGFFPEKIDARIERLPLNEILPLLKKIPEHLLHITRQMPAHNGALELIASGQGVKSEVKPRLSLYGGLR